MNKQIVELKLEQIEDVVGGIAMSVSAYPTYSPNATLAQPAYKLPSAPAPATWRP